MMLHRRRVAFGLWAVVIVILTTVALRSYNQASPTPTPDTPQISPVNGVSLSTGTYSVVTYPTPPAAETSSTYKVTVNGVPVFVQRTNTVSYVHFSFTGIVHIQVTVNEAVKSFRFEPDQR